MNFTTDLPKSDPIVSYIVASAVKCEKFFPGSGKEGPVFRMHAVILKKRKNIDANGSSSGISFNKNNGSVKGKSGSQRTWVPAENATKYILCHVRKVRARKLSDESSNEALSENEAFPQLNSKSRTQNFKEKKVHD